jgi:tetratricopeptide (TPR) repeat protein
MHGIPARIMQSFYGLAFYLGKTVAPFRLLPIYELRFPTDPWQPRFIIAAVVITLAAAGVAALRRRLPGLFVTSLIYVAFLAPVLGLVQNGTQLVADRYSYLPMLGFSILAGGAWARVLWSSFRAAAPLAVLGSIALLASLFTLTWCQCRVWHDSKTLWQYVLAHEPDTAMALNSEGGRLINEQNPTAALPLVQRAVELEPYNLDAQHNLRTVYLALGRMDEFRRLLEAGSQSPEPLYAAEFQFHLGYLAFEQGRLDDAIASFARTIELVPDRAEAHLYWAMALERLSRGSEASLHYRAAGQLKPRMAQGMARTARKLLAQGRTAQAAGMVQTALKVDPRCPEACRLLAEMAGHPAKPQ